MRRKAIVVLLTTFLTVGLNLLPVSAAVVDNPKIMISRTVELKDKDIENGGIDVNQKRNITISQSVYFAVDNPLVNDREIVFLFDNSGSLNERPDKSDDPFDFALFSGGDEEVINIQGNKQTVWGKIHSNGYINIKGDNYEVYSDINNKENTIEYTKGARKNGEFDKNGKFIVGSGTPADLSSSDSFVQKGWISMPDIADALLDKSKQTTITRTKEFYMSDFTTTNMVPLNVNEYPDIKDLNNGTKIGIRYENNELKGKQENMFYIEGKLTVPDNMILRFHGSVLIGNDLEFKGRAIIIADNDVIIKGQNIITPIGKDGSVSSMIYSEQGNISIYTDKTQFNGKLYSPFGKIHLAGSDIKINGSVIANKLNSIQGALDVKYATGPIDVIVDEVTQLPTPAETMKKEIVNFINNHSFTGAATRVNIVSYDKNGNDTDTQLYNITKGDEKQLLLDKIKNIKFDDTSGMSNLGDGLRKAYHLLKNGNIASKSIIVISGSEPNRYTIEPTTGEFYKGSEDLTDDANFQKHATRSVQYAIEMGKLAAKDAIVPYFINFLPTTDSLYVQVNSKLNQISNSIMNYGLYSNEAPIIKKLKQTFEKANPDKTFSLYSPEPVNNVTLSLVVNDILTQLSNPYSAKITSANFEFTLPKGTKLLDKDDKLLPLGFKLKNDSGIQTIMGEIKIDEDNPVVVSGTQDTSTGNAIFEIPPNLLFNKQIADIKFILVEKLSSGQKSRPVTFLKGDCKIEYKIKYIGIKELPSGTKIRFENPDSVKGTTGEDFTVDVYMKIEPN
jgi:hypothetical protein